MNFYDTHAGYADITSYYALNLTSFHMDIHSHIQCEIMYIISGVCDICMEEKNITLKEHQFIFIDSGIPHSLRVSQGSPCSIINLEFCCQKEETHFPLSELRKNSSCFSQLMKNPSDYFVGLDNDMLGYSLKDFIHYLTRDSCGDNYLLSLIFLRILSEMANCILNGRSLLGTLPVRQAKKYIQEHLDEKIYINDIASCIGIHPNYLQTIFSQSEHCSIITYINKLRLEKSIFLLKNSQLSITDIAFETGFNSRQHFAHTFQKHYDMSPQKYRTLYGQYLSPSTDGMQHILAQDKSVIKRTLI